MHLLKIELMLVGILGTDNLFVLGIFRQVLCFYYQYIFYEGIFLTQK